VREGSSADGILLADVGGTNVRFAISHDGTLEPVAHLSVADYSQFGDALAAFLERHATRTRIDRAILGVAGFVEDGHCALTNSPWVVSANELRARFGLSHVRIVNDFQAIAWSLPRLVAADLHAVGGKAAKPGAPMVVIGPGTGLGVAAYLRGKDGDLVVGSEGGHASLASSCPREDAIVAKLRSQYGHVSAERALSGDGLKNLYHAIAALDSVHVPDRSAAEITRAALDGSCTTSRAAVDVFCSFLGSVAGNLTLSFGAQGGVYIAGGIVSHIRDYLLKSEFRSRFEAKGRLRRYLQPIPVYLVLHDDPAFLGLQALVKWI
jgi:glucokinase